MWFKLLMHLNIAFTGRMCYHNYTNLIKYMTICLIIWFNLHIEMELFTQRVSFWFIWSFRRNWNNMRNNISFTHIQILLSAVGKLLQWISYFIFSSFSYFFFIKITRNNVPENIHFRHGARLSHNFNGKVIRYQLQVEESLRFCHLIIIFFCLTVKPNKMKIQRNSFRLFVYENWYEYCRYKFQHFARNSIWKQ